MLDATRRSSAYETLTRYLERRGVPYRKIEHPPGARAEDYNKAVGCRLAQQLKCLLLKITKQGQQSYMVAAIPAQKKADLKALKAALQAKKLRMANQEEMMEVTGCQFGELHPFAGAFSLGLMMDRDFLDETELFLSAGVVDVSMVIAPAALVDAEDPMVL